MRFYKIDAQGPLFLNRDVSVPAADPANEGRIYYETGNEEVFYADAGGWIRMYSENNLTQLVDDINTTGTFLRKDQDDTTAYRLTVNDGVIGDVRATDGSLVLENGSNGNDSHYIGSVRAENNDEILTSGADHDNSSARLGQVLAANGDVVLGISTGDTATIRLDSIGDGDTGAIQLADFSSATAAWVGADIRASNLATVILNSGTDGSDARLRASVTAQDTNTILQCGTDRAASWASLQSIKATNGSDVMVTNTTVSNSTFAGISERAKYA